MNSKFLFEENVEECWKKNYCQCSEYDLISMISELKKMEIISKANEKYCWCFKDVEKHISSSSLVKEYECLNSDISSLGSFEIYPRTEVKRRKRRSGALEIENCIDEIYKLLINGSLKFIVGKTKSKSPFYDSPRPRSSNFIGVSKKMERIGKY